MAAKKKKKKAVKAARKAKRTPARKAARKAAPARKAKLAKKTVRKKAAARKKIVTKKKAARGEYGEGNYKASKRFRKSEEAFVKANKAKIGELGKAAEAALDGPEGGDLRAAEAEAAGHAAGEG